MKNFKNQPAVFAICLLIFSGLVFSFMPGRKHAAKDLATQKCLIVSDIHFSPLYGASLTDTVLKKKLAYATFDEWIKYFEGFPAQMALNSSLFYQDANYAVLRSALTNMKRQLPDPAFIIIAGDFIWHNATPADSVLKRKTIRFIARLFKQAFPGSLIIPAMGNNDTYGNDYDLQDPKFLHDFASAWEPNLPAPSADALKAKGYYACETGNLKVIVINSASLNSGTNYPQAGPMLEWLHGQLADANGKNIWIMMHIPPGINSYNGENFWNINYIQKFVHSIIKYAPSVKLIIASHTHFNDFKIIYDDSKVPAPVALLRIVPSICSNHGNNPSFEVAEFNAATNRLITETNWYLSLATAPKDTASDQVIWTSTLNSPSLLGLGKIDAAGFSKFINNVKNDKTGKLLKNYIHFYTVGTDADSTASINSHNYLQYLAADSMKEK